MSCHKGNLLVKDVDKLQSNFVLVVLTDAFGNPENVSDLLLLQLDVTVKGSIVEHLLETQHIQAHFVLIKDVVDGLLMQIRSSSLAISSQINLTEQVAIVAEALHSNLDLFFRRGLDQLVQTDRSQDSKVREETQNVVLAQISILPLNKLYRNGNRSSVCLKLFCSNNEI